MDDHHAGTEALAQILDGDQHHFHHPNFSTHHSHKLAVNDVHNLDLANVEDDTGGEEELDLALGDMGTPDMDTPQRTSTFGRPPSIRKGDFPPSS